MYRSNCRDSNNFYAVEFHGEKKMSKQNAETKSYPACKCQRCGEITRIDKSHDWTNLKASLHSYKELHTITLDRLQSLNKQKHTMFASLNKTIFELYDLMTPEQIQKGKAKHKQLKERIRMAEKQFKNPYDTIRELEKEKRRLEYEKRKLEGDGNVGQ